MHDFWVKSALFSHFSAHERATSQNNVNACSNLSGVNRLSLATDSLALRTPKGNFSQAVQGSVTVDLPGDVVFHASSVVAEQPFRQPIASLEPLYQNQDVLSFSQQWPDLA